MGPCDLTGGGGGGGQANEILANPELKMLYDMGGMESVKVYAKEQNGAPNAVARAQQRPLPPLQTLAGSANWPADFTAVACMAAAGVHCAPFWRPCRW